MNQEKKIKRDVRSHYKIIGDKLVPKKVYNTEKEATIIALFLNTTQNAIHQKVAYKCVVCGKWHIGSTKKILTNDDKKIYQNKLKKYNIIM